jgi:hypothetical protein
VYLGVVDAERLDLDDDVTGLGLGLWNVLVDEAVQADRISREMARMMALRSDRQPPARR